MNRQPSIHEFDVQIATDPRIEGNVEALSPTDLASLDTPSGHVGRATKLRASPQRGVTQLSAAGSEPLCPTDLETCDTLSDRVGRVTQPQASHMVPDIPNGGAGLGPFFTVPQDSADDIAKGRQPYLTDVDPLVIQKIREAWRKRQTWHRAEKSLTLQAKAVCRSFFEDGSKTKANTLFTAAEKGDLEFPNALEAYLCIRPFLEAGKGIREHRESIEKDLKVFAKDLPTAPFIKTTYGIDYGSLAAIVGEAGDLNKYSNPAKLWKRFGLAVMPDGRQGKRADKDLALLHGYSPSRRSVMYVIGGGLIGGMGKGYRPSPGEDVSLNEALSPLAKLFVDRLRFEAEKDPAAYLGIVTNGKGVEKESYTVHAKNRAQRYVEKRFLRMLWQAWRCRVCLGVFDTLGPGVDSAYDSP